MTARSIVIMFIAAAGLVLLGDRLVTPRNVHLGYDAAFYAAMVDGPMADVPPPFRFRVLVPWLARQLPMSPPAALRLITDLSLFACYLIMMASCRLIGLGLRDAMVGVAAVWGSTWHLYYFWNPYLTDAFGLLMLTIMMWAVLTGTLWAFAMASVTGVLAREGTLMLVPVWLVTRQWPASLAVAAASIVVAAMPHLWMEAVPASTSAAVVPAGPRLSAGPLAVLRQLLAIWGLVWFLAIAGAAHVPRAYTRRLGAVAAALLFGAIAASMVATDTGRMFGFLAPVLAVACAQCFATLRRRAGPLAMLMAASIAVQWWFNAPDVVIEPASWLAGWPRRLFVSTQLLLGMVIVIRLLRPAPSGIAGTESALARTQR